MKTKPVIVNNEAKFPDFELFPWKMLQQMKRKQDHWDKEVAKLEQTRKYVKINKEITRIPQYGH